MGEGTHDVTHVPGTPKGEEVDETEGKEPGRQDTGTEFESKRPTGTSDARDFTGVDPQDPQSGTTKG